MHVIIHPVHNHNIFMPVYRHYFGTFRFITFNHRCDGCYPMEIFVGSIPDDINSRSISPDRKYGYLDVQDGDIIAYTTQASEAVYLIVQDGKETRKVEAEILQDNFKHTGNKMYISVHKDNKLSNAYKKIEVEFEVKHLFFDNMHEVLNNLGNEVVRRIFPQKEDFTCKVRADDRSILRHIPKEYENIFHLYNNMEPNQREAYQVALSCQSGAPPVLISGAFGTGKTCFLSSVAYCFISEAERNVPPARVLICTHHQATADTILQTYFGPMLEHESLPLQTKVLRVISNQRNVYPKQKYSRWYRKMCDFKNEACQYFSIPTLVIITTFLTSFKFKGLFPPDYFTHILIDEGAQAREPEAVAPLCLATQRTKIIIAGDARQVSNDLHRSMSK